LFGFIKSRLNMKSKNFLRSKIVLTCLLLTSGIFGSLVKPEPASALKQYELDMIKVYKDVSPSVVSVMTTSYDEEDVFMDPVPRQGAGSGVVIDSAGHILTNYHVIEGAQKIEIVYGKKSYPAKVIGGTPNNDLAILQASAPAGVLRPAKLGDSSKLQVGQTAIAIGNPFGILSSTMTAGIISALNRDVKIQNSVYRGMIQTDAPINGGNSGGPLVNSNSEVIGINTLIFSQTGGSVGIGFSIPINTAKKFIPSLISKGEVTYPWLGVSVLPLNAGIAQTLKLPVSEGLLVLSTVPGSAAQKAGIRGGSKYIILRGNQRLPIGGDIIVALDNEKVVELEDLSSYLETNKSVGDTVTVRVIRGNKAGSISVKLQARPSSVK
jgi:S1-C subfamily serine protease